MDIEKRRLPLPKDSRPRQPRIYRARRDRYEDMNLPRRFASREAHAEDEKSSPVPLRF
jgi:hypothetical protein